MTYLTIVCLAQSGLIAWLLIDRRVERRENTRERADLCQRLQAPEAAVIAHQVQALPSSPLPPAFDDDRAFHESLATREDLARLLEREDERR